VAIFGGTRDFGWSLQVLGEAGDGSRAGGGSLRSTRTTQGLQRARGRGVRLGRPCRCSDSALVWAAVLKAEGLSLADITALFNTAKVPTPGGGPSWYPSYVSRLLKTQDAQSIVAALERAGPSHLGTVLRDVAAELRQRAPYVATDGRKDQPLSAFHSLPPLGPPATCSASHYDDLYRRDAAATPQLATVRMAASILELGTALLRTAGTPS
jgi:hypothetical protein